MNAGFATAATLDAATVTALAPSAVPGEAANDAAPAPTSRVTLPARLSIRGRRERRMSVDISREAVTIRPEAGEAAATRPITSYRGVAVRVERGEGGPFFHLSLMHDEAEHSVPLSSGTEAAVVAREWQAWAKALSLPLLAVEPDGSVHAELTALGVVLAERPSDRRRGSPLVGRRSRYARRRRDTPVRGALEDMPVVRDAHEIIART